MAFASLTERAALKSAVRGLSRSSLPARQSAVLPRLRPAPLTSQSRTFASSSSASNKLVQTEPAADDFESLYSARYRGQGAKRERPPWYKSPTLLLLGFMPIFTFGLGCWQVQRLDWKLGLIEELEYKLRKEPIRLPKNINLDVLPSFDFRLVSLSGYFDHSRTMFLGPRVREGVMGYNVVVPLIRDEGGGEVLVDRGFVSEKSMIINDKNGDDRRLRDGEAVQPSGHVSLTALLPRISPPNYFTPANQPERNRWFHADPAAMAEYASSGGGGSLKLGSEASQGDTDSYTPSAGVSDSVQQMLGLKNGREEHHVLPILAEEVFEGYDGNVRVEKGIPVGRAATIELRNQHSVYAFTWFSLSAVTSVMFGILVRKRG